jgi:hypothetical protein
MDDQGLGAAKFGMMTNTEFVHAVNCRFGGDSVFVRDPFVRLRPLDATCMFASIVNGMDVSIYTMLLESIDDDQFLGFLRFFAASIKRFKSVKGGTVSRLWAALAQRDHDRFWQHVGADKDVQIALILSMQYYFS